MSKIEELIKYYSRNDTRKENALIKANLKLINDLLESIKDSQDRIYIEKIISTCLEVIDFQREIIDNSVCTDMMLASYVPNVNEFISTSQSPEDKPSDIEIARSLNPYFPPEGGFLEDAQIRDAFANYLKYHIVKKDGTPKTFADTTVYDYCSRIKVLWEIIYKEWQEGLLENKVSFLDECVQPGKAFLNAYANIRVLDDYIQFKSVQIRKIAAGERPPFTADEMRNNPLNNPRNLSNSIAALERFKEFKEKQ